MTKIKMIVELDYDEEIMYNDDTSKKWFFNDVLQNYSLNLYSYLIDDQVGDIKVLYILDKIEAK